MAKGIKNVMFGQGRPFQLWFPSVFGGTGDCRNVKLLLDSDVAIMFIKCIVNRVKVWGIISE